MLDGLELKLFIVILLLLRLLLGSTAGGFPLLGLALESAATVFEILDSAFLSGPSVVVADDRDRLVVLRGLLLGRFNVHHITHISIDCPPGWNGGLESLLGFCLVRLLDLWKVLLERALLDVLHLLLVELGWWVRSGSPRV